MPTGQFMIYGANGYTGALTARQAVQAGMQPVLAGRSRPQIQALAEELNLPYLILSLEDTATLENALRQVDVVLHCAGPFRHTSRPMAAACLRTGTHYLNITGEIDVYQSLAGLDKQAQAAEVMLLPGIGFDVVSTDCLAARLKARLPGATHLSLAFKSYGPAGFSPGTAKSFLEGLGSHSLIRQNGQLTPVPVLSKTRQIDFGEGGIEVPRMQWGDVFTAYYSTGIKNIENYYSVGKQAVRMLRLARWAGPLLKLKPVKNLLKKVVAERMTGPTADEIAQSRVVVWGEVIDEQGNTAVSRLHTPEAYSLTARSSLAAVRRVLAGEAPTGYQTPSTAFGKDFVLEVPDTNFEDLG